MKPYFEKFQLTEDHIKLLQKMYCSFRTDAYDGAPEIDAKRPYGNSDVAGDVNEIVFQEEFDEDDDMPEELYERCMALHKETGKALQICLSTTSFKPGLYGRPTSYNTQTWEWISE
jgi:hypothetical protein